jgi:hypothetical protein
MITLVYTVMSMVTGMAVLTTMKVAGRNSSLNFRLEKRSRWIKSFSSG